jgi:hypothetical protein
MFFFRSKEALLIVNPQQRWGQFVALCQVASFQTTIIHHLNLTFLHVGISSGNMGLFLLLKISIAFLWFAARQ